MEKYTLLDLIRFTRLSERSLRRFISEGVLCGEKQNYKWFFTTQNILDFLSNDSVAAIMESKFNTLLREIPNSFSSPEPKKGKVFHIINPSQETLDNFLLGIDVIIKATKERDIDFIIVKKAKTFLVITIADTVSHFETLRELYMAYNPSVKLKN